MISTLLIVSLILLIFLKTPISIAMGLASLFAAWAGNYPIHLLPQGIYNSSVTWSLLAVPFFIIAGNLMNEFGIAKRIFDFMNILVGHVRGGLAHVNVLASMVFAGISGSASADCAGLGPIELKAMKDAGYDDELSAGITLASSTIGPIIPPSVSFIIYAVISGTSIAKMFIAGIVPGLIIGITLMLTNYVICLRNPEKLPRKLSRSSIKEIIKTFYKGIFSLIAPLIILFGMVSGFVSPTEAGIVAILYSIFLGVIYKTFSASKLIKVMEVSLLTTAHSLILVGLASTMSNIMTFERTPYLVAQFILSITNNKIIVLLLIDLLLLIVGCLMTGISNVVLLTPILIPLMQTLGVDLIHFGVVMGFGTVIGVTTPPVGVGLFIISDISKLSIERVVRGTLVYYPALIIALIIITFIPFLSTWLPNLLFPGW